MFKKILSHQSSSISSAAFTVAIFTVIGSLFSIFRNTLLAARFGAGEELDMYYAAFRIPDFIYSVFYLGVVSVLFLPIFNDLYAKNRDQAWRFFGAMMNWVLIMLGAAALVLLFAAPAIVKLMVPGFSPQQISIVANMTRLMLIQPIILGVSNIISGALQSFGRFAAASMGHISYNAGIIFGILVLVPSFGIYGLVGGVLVGAFLHLAMQLPSFNQIRENFTFRLASDFQIVQPYVKLITPRR